MLRLPLRPQPSPCGCAPADTSLPQGHSWWRRGGCTGSRSQRTATMSGMQLYWARLGADDTEKTRTPAVLAHRGFCRHCPCALHGRVRTATAKPSALEHVSSIFVLFWVWLAPFGCGSRLLPSLSARRVVSLGPYSHLPDWEHLPAVFLLPTNFFAFFFLSRETDETHGPSHPLASH